MSKDKLTPKSMRLFLSEIERLELKVNSFILMQDGKVEAQFWRKPYREGTQQLLFSLSKSFTSIAVGIAWDNGYLDLQDKVISFFPDKLPDTPSIHLKKMTIHHLLSMNAGHHDNIYCNVASEKDWVKAFLSQEIQHEPGSYYRYSTHSTYMLAAILERVTDQNLVDFLMPRLFEPLGISRPVWELCPMGITAGGMGLSIPTEGIARFGQMLLDGGLYDGQRIVSEAYIEMATQEQSDNRRDEVRADSAQGYGYQFFLCREGCFRGGGAFGQLCFVAPEKRIVIAATSSLSSGNELQVLLDLVYEHLIHKSEEEIVPNLDERDLLQQQLSKMIDGIPIHPFGNDLCQTPNYRSYRMNGNPQGIRCIELNPLGSGSELLIHYENGDHKRLLFDCKQPMTFQDRFVKDLSLHLQEVVSYAGWEDERTLKLTLVYIETPYIVTYTLKFIEEKLELHCAMNVSLNKANFEITGIHADIVEKDEEKPELRGNS